MLVSLRVRDLAVLEDVEVSLAEGFTAVTGETGAGKSLLVDALGLLSGERADATLVRTGAERLVVEGAFETSDPEVSRILLEAGLADDDSVPRVVVVRRELTAAGKGRLFVDGSPAPVKTLQEVAARLLVLHGQAEARELLDPAAPRELLDRFARLSGETAAVGGAYRDYRRAEEERQRIASAASDRELRLSLLQHQIDEIDATSPKDGDEESLAREKAVLSNVEKVGRLLSDASAALDSEDGGALYALTAARKAFAALAEVDPTYAARASECGDLVERLADLAATTARDLDRLEADPGRLAVVAERLDALARLKRKYGPELADVLRHRQTIGRERDELEDLEGALRKAEARAQAAFEDYRRKALSLSAARTAAAPLLGKRIEQHLLDLAFLSASFTVEVSRRADAESPLEAGGERVAFSASGIDQVRLAFSPNPGEAPRPLAKIASGGELSRVQLAISVALAEDDGAAVEASRAPRTFVFDEVDAGVSGATAEAVGRKLRTLSSREQVLVVTHLPQVAARATHHLFVAKEAVAGRTRTRIDALDRDGRVESLAAMLGGSAVGDAARENARQLLEEAARAPSTRKRGRK